jgi:hypothetical protein
MACVGAVLVTQTALADCCKEGEACCPPGGIVCRLPGGGACCVLAGKAEVDPGCLTSGFVGLGGSSSSAARLAALVQLVPALASVTSTGAEEEPGGWLGVVMSPLPEPLAAQLELEDLGMMVINVMKDSPADRAGLKQYDVILEFDGQNLSESFKEFADMVRAHQPGDQVEIRILRAAEPMTLTATLSERPEEESGGEYLYDLHPRNMIEQELKGLGQIFRRDDDGNWIIEDLGEIDDFSPQILDLPQRLKLPRFSWSARVDADTEVAVKRQEDGKTLEVRRRGGSDSPIVVKRTREEDGEQVVEEKTYEDEDELKDQDPEAYELYDSAGGKGRCRIEWCAPDLKDLKKLQQEWSFKIGRALKENEPQWRDAVAEAFEAARRAREEAMENYEEALRLHKDELDAPLLKKWQGKWLDSYAPVGGPRTDITVQPDGEIHVTTRKGGVTLKRVFRNADELREQDENLYDKYQDMLEAEQEIQE